MNTNLNTKVAKIAMVRKEFQPMQHFIESTGSDVQSMICFAIS